MIKNIEEAIITITARITDAAEKTLALIEEAGDYTPGDVVRANEELERALESRSPVAIAALSPRTMLLVRLKQANDQILSLKETKVLLCDQTDRIVFSNPAKGLISPAGFHPSEGVFVKGAR